jgi:hypothetical protein
MRAEATGVRALSLSCLESCLDIADKKESPHKLVARERESSYTSSFSPREVSISELFEQHRHQRQ